MAKKENIASVLAFEKKLVPSDGYMYGTNWEDRESVTPLKLQEKSVRGTISNRLKKAIQDDPAKLNAEVEKPNLQTVDVSALGTDLHNAERCDLPCGQPPEACPAKS